MAASEEELAALKERVAQQDTVIRFLCAAVAQLYETAPGGGRSAFIGAMLRPTMLLVPNDVAAAMIASGATPLEALAIVAKEMPRFAGAIEVGTQVARLLGANVTWTDIGLTLASRTVK
jgi:hypothetical protein